MMRSMVVSCDYFHQAPRGDIPVEDDESSEEEDDDDIDSNYEDESESN